MMVVAQGRVEGETQNNLFVVSGSVYGVSAALDDGHSRPRMGNTVHSASKCGFPIPNDGRRCPGPMMVKLLASAESCLKGRQRVCTVSDCTT